MTFTTTPTIICDITAAITTRRNNNIDWHSSLSLPQQQQHMRTVAAVMNFQSSLSSPIRTLYGDDDDDVKRGVPQILSSSTTGNNIVDHAIAFLDAALEIVDQSDIFVPDASSRIRRYSGGCGRQ
jgi:hypothetical protein